MWEAISRLAGFVLPTFFLNDYKKPAIEADFADYFSVSENNVGSMA